MSRVPAGLIVMALGAGLVHGPAAGQTHAEFRGGLTVGNHTATAAGLDFAPALSYEALVVQRITPRLSVYGGYVRTAFGCEEGFCLDRDLTVTGNHGVLGGEAGIGGAWVRLGVLFGVTEVGTEGEPADPGPGAEVPREVVTVPLQATDDHHAVCALFEGLQDHRFIHSS